MIKGDKVRIVFEGEVFRADLDTVLVKFVKDGRTTFGYYGLSQVEVVGLESWTGKEQKDGGNVGTGIGCDRTFASNLDSGGDEGSPLGIAGAGSADDLRALSEGSGTGGE